MIDDIFIAYEHFPMLTKNIILNRNSTIYNLYQTRFRIFITSVSERIKAVIVPKNIAHHLGIRATEPVLKISRIGYTYHQVPVEWRISYLYSKQVDYHVAEK